MPALTRTPRGDWIKEGLRALADGGPDAVRVEPLARKLGVSKGGFYWHFDGRQALLEEILDAWERVMVDEVIDRVEDAGGGARTRLRHLFALASSQEVRPLIKVDLAVRDWSRRDKKVARRLRRVDNRRMDYMRSLFRDLVPDEDEVEARCLLAFALFVGPPFMAVDHGRRSRAEVVELALKRLEA